MTNFNGNLESKEHVFSSNRAFKYADAIFETIKVVNGTILFWEDHYFRLMASMRIIRMEIPMEFTMEFLEAEVLKLIKQLDLVNSSARVRITVYRTAEGLYTPENNDVSYVVDKPICSLLFNNNPSVNSPMTASRSTPAAFIDRYGNRQYALSGSVTNYLTYSNDLTQWLDTFGRWSINGTVEGPFGDMDATEIELDVDTAALTGTGSVLENTITGIIENDIVTVSFYVKVEGGTLSGFDFTLSPSVFRTTVNFPVSPSDGWIRVEYPTHVTATPTFFGINPRGAAGTRVSIYQANITNTPSPYEIINTINNPVTIELDNYQPRDSDIGYLLESGKTNLCHYSSDLTVAF